MAKQVRPGVLTPDSVKRQSELSLLKEIARVARVFTEEDMQSRPTRLEQRYLKILLTRLDEIDAG